MKFLGLVLLIALLAIIIAADPIHYYSGNLTAQTANLIVPKTYSKKVLGKDYEISSNSASTSSYNISVNISESGKLDVIKRYTFTINATSIYTTYYGLTTYIIPLSYNVSYASSKDLAISNLSLVFDQENVKIPLILNGQPLNQTYTVQLLKGLSSINVTWTPSRSITNNYVYTAKISLMVVISPSKGINYVYFWNIFIKISTGKGNNVAPYYYVKEYPALDLQQIINILNSISK